MSSIFWLLVLLRFFQYMIEIAEACKSSPPTPPPKKNFGKFCGVPTREIPSQHLRIHGGRAAKLGEIPWQVAVTNTNIGNLCGGTLVSDRHVITAKHCSNRSKVSEMKVIYGVLGYDQVLDHSNQHDVIRKIEHDTTDIAVLVLKNFMNWDATPDVRPACLPYQETIKDLAGKPALVSGWGIIQGNKNGEHSTTLEKLTVPIIGRKDCGNWGSDVFPEGMFCAGYLHTNKGTCFGDSGGPLVAKGRENAGAATLFGVAVFVSSDGCGAEGYNDGYADVQYQMESGWLKTQLEGAFFLPPPPPTSWSPQ